jgi:hypothetical protein
MVSTRTAMALIVKVCPDEIWHYKQKIWVKQRKSIFGSQQRMIRVIAFTFFYLI